MHEAHDAAGRPVTTGDTVGATIAAGSHQTTLIGPVLHIDVHRVRVLVTNQPTGDSYRYNNGDYAWLLTRRTFLVHQAAERTWHGFRTPDGRLWTLSAHTGQPSYASADGRTWTPADADQPFYESPMVPTRYDAPALRAMYDGLLAPVWQDTPPPPPDAVRASAWLEAANRLEAMPQDYELDPGRGDAVQLLHSLAGHSTSSTLTTSGSTS